MLSLQIRNNLLEACDLPVGKLSTGGVLSSVLFEALGLAVHKGLVFTKSLLSLSAALYTDFKAIYMIQSPSYTPISTGPIITTTSLINHYC